MIEIIKTPSIDLNIDEFTHNVETDNILGTVTGDGIFDTLMETATKHLLVQFESNRIRQEDYANAYIHIYEVTLQAALKAWLEKDLVAAQIRQTEAGTAKIEAETAKTTAEMTMIQPQIDKIEAETAKIEAETSLLPLQKTLLEAEAQKTAAETGKIESETTKIEAETELLPLQKDILLVEKSKVEAETARIESETKLVQPQIAKLEAETDKVEAETTLIPEQLNLLAAQAVNESEKLKLLAEQLKLLTAQKGTEENKAALYRRQIEGFDESYKEKILKIMLDAWGIGFSVGGDSFSAENIPVPMTSTAINGVFETYVQKDLDSYKYSRVDDTVEEEIVTPPKAD